MVEGGGFLPDRDPAITREILRTLHVESRRYVAPIYWGSDPYDANSVAWNASCFFVQVDTHRFGVTAHHVIAAFLKDRDAGRASHLMIRNCDIPDWESREIASDAVLDLSTFRVSDAEFAEIQIRPFQTDIGHWPPTPPQIGRGVFFTGYADAARRVVDSKTVEFEAISNGVVLTNLDPAALEVQIRRSSLQPVELGGEVPSILRNLSGFSGAPLLTVSDSVAELFRLGGVILRQMPAKDEDDVVTIFARRPECIRPDGALVVSSRHVLPT